MKKLCCLLAVLCSSQIVGCNGSEFGWPQSESGADVDDPAINGKNTFLVGGYQSSADVIPIFVPVDAGMTAEEFALQVETVWNSLPGIQQIGRCENQPSIIMFPSRVDDLVFLDEDGVTHRLGEGTITLGNGIRIRRHTGPCPPAGPEP